MVRIAGGTGVIVVTDIHCVGAPAEVRLRMLVGPMGAVRRDLRQETRRQLKWLAATVADGEGDVRETPRGPVGCGAWQDLGMSLAYAGNRALVAVARGWQVGVDLLADHHLSDWPVVAAVFFRQASAIAALPTSMQSLAYATAWAELEAELKCLGLPLQEGWISPDDPSVWRLTPQISQGVAALVLRKRTLVQGPSSPSINLAVSRSTPSSLASSRWS